MPTDRLSASGSILVVDWRGGAMPQEPSRLLPAVVVEDHGLFPDEYPSTLVVPKPLRDAVGLQPGAEVEISRYGAGLQLVPAAIHRPRSWTPSWQDRLTPLQRRLAGGYLQGVHPPGTRRPATPVFRR